MYGCSKSDSEFSMEYMRTRQRFTVTELAAMEVTEIVLTEMEYAETK